jgi:antitoxin ParD1/3/4
MNAATKTIHISLPPSLLDSAKVQAEEGQFSNMSDYIRTLIRDDVRRAEQEKLEKLLLEGHASARGMAVGSPDWQVFRQRLSSQQQGRPSPKGA